MKTSSEIIVIEEQNQPVPKQSRISQLWHAVSDSAYNSWQHTTHFVKKIDPAVTAVSVTIVAGMGMYGYFNIYATEFAPSALLYLATGGGLVAGALFQLRPENVKAKAFFAGSQVAVKHTTKTMFQASMIYAIEISTYQAITKTQNPMQMPVLWKVLLPIGSTALGIATHGAVHKLKHHKSDNQMKKAFVHAAFDASQLGSITSTFGGDNLYYINQYWTPITAGILFTVSASNQIFFANYPRVRTVGETAMKIFGVLSLGIFLYDNLVDPYALIKHAITGIYDVPESYMIAMAVPTGIFVVCVSSSKILHAYNNYSDMQNDERAKLIQNPDDLESNQRSLPFISSIGEQTTVVPSATDDPIPKEKDDVLTLIGGPNNVSK